MKRVMCVYLPRWPLQRLEQVRPELRDKPAAIVRTSPGRGASVVLCSATGSRAGIGPGMPVAEARAIEPRLATFEEDPAGDRQALLKLAAWAERYSPIVGLEEGPAPECLLLDVTGCAPCFHGEDRLTQRVVDEFRQKGWLVRVAIARTIGIAQCQVKSGEKRVEDTPITIAFPLSTLHSSLFTTLGIERIGQLLEVPRGELAGRFGAVVLRRLDQMMGRVPELILPCRWDREVQARCSFEFPTDSRPVLEHALDDLLERIVAILQAQQRGARRLECWFYHENAQPTRLDIRLFRASPSTAHLRKLLMTRLEPLQMADPVCGICLRVPVAELLAGRQQELFAEEAPREEELAVLIDHLVGRLGEGAVTFATLVPDPQPEYACRFDPAIKERMKDEGRRMKKDHPSSFILHPLFAPLPRPSFLWPIPEPIEVLSLTSTPGPALIRRGGKEYTVRRSWGPERIETGWWRGLDIQRDYYVVETNAGTRWWIFRRKDDRWFIHGCFD